MAAYIRDSILRAIADDYESFDAIVRAVAEWTSDEKVKLTRQEIAQGLHELINEGYTKAYLLSPHEPYSQAVEFSMDHLDDLWFYITPEGKDVLRQA